MRHTFCFLYVFVYLGLKGSHISCEKKTKKNVKDRQGYIQYLCKISWSHLSKMVCTFGL